MASSVRISNSQGKHRHAHSSHSTDLEPTIPFTSEVPTVTSRVSASFDSPSKAPPVRPKLKVLEAGVQETETQKVEHEELECKGVMNVDLEDPELKSDMDLSEVVVDVQGRTDCPLDVLVLDPAFL